MQSPTPPDVNREKGAFQTTRWSVIRGAAKKNVAESRETPEVQQALADLCRNYWYPLYAFARRQGETPESAMDLTQGFFADLLEKSWIDRADPQQGRFRSFLITVFRRFISDQKKRANAAKRGGNKNIFSIDAGDAEQRYQMEPTDDVEPSDLFQRQWAMELLGRVYTRLEQEHIEKGREEQFQILRQYLSTTDGSTYEEIAPQLGMNENTVKITVYRLRKRFRTLLEEEVLQTVDSASDIQSELNELLTALCRNH